MRGAIVWGIVGIVFGLASSARADEDHVRSDEAEARPDAAVALHTRDIVSKYGKSARRRRLIGGVAMLTLGAVALPAGVLTYPQNDRGGLFDLTTLEYGVSYFMLGAGAIYLLGGTLVLLQTTPQETIRDDLETAIARGDVEGGVARARKAAATKARRAERVRGGVRWAGLGIMAAGAASIAVVALGPTELDSGPGLALGLAGSGALVGGTVCLMIGLTESPIEKLRDDLHRSSPALTARAAFVSAGVVPLRGGAMLGISSAF